MAGKKYGVVVRLPLSEAEYSRIKKHSRDRLGVNVGRWLADAARKRYEEEKAA